MDEKCQILNFLTSDTVRLLSSSQAITSISSAVKELFENALDAGSTNVQVKLEDFGVDLIEIKDDGYGISGDNVHKMFLPGYTSKISKFSDLDLLTTYGFRGQALAALCSVADVSITTKTDKDALAMTYVIDKNGKPISSAPSHLPKGTIISVKNIFKTLPVRKHFLSNKKRKTAELNKIESVVKALAVVNCPLRVVLIHNKNTIWQKNSVNGLKQSMMQASGLKVVSKMEYLTQKWDDMTLEMVVPKKDLNDAQLLFTAIPGNFLFINKRPIIFKELSKVIAEIISHYFKISDQHPMFLASISLPSEAIDVNLEPNKMKVLLKNQPDVIALLLKCLESYYGPVLKSGVPPDTLELDQIEELPSKRPKFDESFLLEEDNRPKTISVCSEINKKNCILASDEEILELSEKPSSQMITASAQICREDIQERRTNELEKTGQDQELFDKALVSINNSKKKPELSVMNWSRGAVGLNDGTVLQPAAQLVQNTRVRETESVITNVGEEYSKIDNLPVSLNNKIAKDVETFNLSLPSPSSQMGTKELSGFTKFARIMRPKIIAEHPNIAFTKVSVLLSERWQGLTTDEQAYYESVAKAVDDKRKKHEKLKIQTTIKPTIQRPNRPPRRKIHHKTTIAQIASLRQNPDTVFGPSPRLVGQLYPNSEWIYAADNKIGLLRNDALNQLVLYQKMIAGFRVPQTELATRFYLTKTELGDDLFEILKNLETEFDQQKCVDVVTSPCVEKNGFRVEFMKTDDGKIVSVILTHGPLDIESAVEQLIETLKLYQTFGEHASLGNLRPKSVLIYITNEVKRITTKQLKLVNRGETASLLKNWRDCLSHLPGKDLEDREIFVPFYETSLQLI